MQYICNVGTLGFTRLAINGLEPTGMQPMTRDYPTCDYRTWVCNGEIYNWRELADQYDLDNKSGSDCEIIGQLYDRFATNGIPLEGFFRALDGVFAMIIIDSLTEEVIVARDPYGVRPLYMGRKGDQISFASEMKALPICDTVETFLPGHFQIIGPRATVHAPRPYHTIPFLKNPIYDEPVEAMKGVRAALEAAVKKRMMMERPVAALLSGGLDSSLIAALVAKQLRLNGGPTLRTFSIGMEGSSDLLHARKVSDWIGSLHKEIVLTADDFFNAVPEVIRTIESYDTTTVRASVGNWLVAKAVAETDCKVVFNGDGADEVWGSYLYFYSAPSDSAFEEETTRLLEDIHMFDVLRSDRSISSHGLEPRTPYLDKEFVGVAKSVATWLRRPGKLCEKWLMRSAFEDDVLPKEVLWRRKEAFSDGVSGDRPWFEIAQEKAAAILGPDWQNKEFPARTPEQQYYLNIFLEHYGKEKLLTNVPYFWMPKWSPGVTDPSARKLGVY